MVLFDWAEFDPIAFQTFNANLLKIYFSYIIGQYITI